MAQKKRRGRKKHTPTISNTGFIGSVFIDTLELQKKSYYFSRKKLQIVHHVLDGLAEATSSLFHEHEVAAYISCVYLHKQKKIGFVLSTKLFEQTDGIAYFKNYLIEKNFYGKTDQEVEYQEVFNTGFIGVVFADLSSIDRFNFEFEMNMLFKLMKDMIIPVKELFLRHNIPAYISTSHLETQNKVGFVLSIKPYDERAEADLYFETYLKERGLFIGDEEDEMDKIVIRKKVELL
ncbi:hypothetical protein ACRS6Y_08640 [Bacillus cytotoxicus]|uniref:Group-specific protein n=2 Tax=Bacillus cytotoxicus TaxID=580165 RepID=A0AAX2CGT3_9BACI|nr:MULTISPECIES: hypothetical protein [Bacillus cereus group]ABS22152.1 conserved hypothetical protein [Bacillus cytotoxicus NVH 391-98]AWC32772.1 hypothetical protein CG482_010315 [Bacillus cytotoxicus]AWC36799.1 hypothetical protein CG481_010330 [Bacillus cytotoxicus]AWC44833.1 hypothetical protein CG479_010095 [Bacillus cytotoxicus]AWC61058.1 hypothetical protein CG474_010390 [Bacillus cytotoxicus]